MTKNKHGGKRAGAGRPKRTGKPPKTISLSLSPAIMAEWKWAIKAFKCSQPKVLLKVILLAKQSVISQSK